MQILRGGERPPPTPFGSVGWGGGRAVFFVVGVAFFYWLRSQVRFLIGGVIKCCFIFSLEVDRCSHSTMDCFKNVCLLGFLLGVWCYIPVSFSPGFDSWLGKMIFGVLFYLERYVAGRLLRYFFKLTAFVLFYRVYFCL